MRKQHNRLTGNYLERKLFVKWAESPQGWEHKLLIWGTQKGKCVFCESEMTIKEATYEHVVPISEGGTNNKNNLILLHAHCNKQINDYRQRILKIMRFLITPIQP